MLSRFGNGMICRFGDWRIWRWRVYCSEILMKHGVKYGRNRSITAAAIIFILCSFSSCSFDHQRSAHITPSVLNDSSWVFTATYSIPQSGRAGPVNGNYSVIYLSQKLRVYLPYFGTSYGGADVLSSDNPLDFVSTDFTSVALQGRKGEHNIVIKPADKTQVSSMSFTFYDNGNAHLDVVMNNRSGISFSGNVR